jgi:hypothetical protein
MLVSCSFYLPLVVAALQLSMIVSFLPLLVLFNFGLKCLDLLVLSTVCLLLLALLSDSLIEAEAGGEGTNDCRDECCDNEGLLEVFLW